MFVRAMPLEQNMLPTILVLLKRLGGSAKITYDELLFESGRLVQTRNEDGSFTITRKEDSLDDSDDGGVIVDCRD